MYEKEFRRDVECLMMAKHKNVVRFLGYCADTQGTMARHEAKFVMADVQQRLLCFEYLPKGSLHDYITGKIIRHTYFLFLPIFSFLKVMLFCMQHIAHTHYIHSDIKGTSFAISPSRYIS
jgi:serine/threonine protein kinase